jgi:catechol-2,3-dioxygenase
MASTVVQKNTATRARVSATRRAVTRGTKPPRNLIDDVTAVLLISSDPKRLAEFYRATLGLPMRPEMHDGIRPHYGHTLGDVHFAIHNAEDWSGVRTRHARSPVVTFSTSHVKAVAKRLSARGVAVKGPTDHGFGHLLSFRDPDGNHITVVEYAPEYW